jgi:polyhydroxyalkanoate synthase
MVYALVNRPSILDLEPGRSLIRGLVEAGRDVYLLDWGDPTEADHERSLDDFVLGTLARAVTAIGRGRPVDLLGVCQGGVLSLLYTASHPNRVRRLVTMVTPVDFHTGDDLLSHWVRSLEQSAVAESRRIPGFMLEAVFQSLAPFRIGMGKVIDLLDHIHDEAWVRRFRRMEQWVHDCPDQPTRFAAAFSSRFYQQNCLLNGPFEFGDTRVDLRQIRSPLLNIYGLHDHIVPPASSRALAGLTESRRYTEIAMPTGHIGMFVSSRASALPRQIAGWLAHR